MGHRPIQPGKQGVLSKNTFKAALSLSTTTLSGHRIPLTLLLLIYSCGGYLKDSIYGNPRPQTLDQLKENICRKIRNIYRETFPKVMENMTTRLQAVIGQRGAYVEHVV